MDEFEKVLERLKEELGEDQITTASDPKIKRPERALERQAIDDFMDRNPMAGGGMLVQPSADGSRPGYAFDTSMFKLKDVKKYRAEGKTAKEIADIYDVSLSRYEAFVAKNKNKLPKVSAKKINLTEDVKQRIKNYDKWAKKNDKPLYKNLGDGSIASDTRKRIRDNPNAIWNFKPGKDFIKFPLKKITEEMLDLPVRIESKFFPAGNIGTNQYGEQLTLRKIFEIASRTDSGAALVDEFYENPTEELFKKLKQKKSDNLSSERIKNLPPKARQRIRERNLISERKWRNSEKGKAYYRKLMAEKGIFSAVTPEEKIWRNIYRAARQTRNEIPRFEIRYPKNIKINPTTGLPEPILSKKGNQYIPWHKIYKDISFLDKETGQIIKFDGVKDWMKNNVEDGVKKYDKAIENYKLQTNISNIEIDGQSLGDIYKKDRIKKGATATEVRLASPTTVNHKSGLNNFWDLEVTTSTANQELNNKIQSKITAYKNAKTNLEKNNIFKQMKIDASNIVGGGTLEIDGQIIGKDPTPKTIASALQKELNLSPKQLETILAGFSKNPKCIITFGKKKVAAEGGRIGYVTGSANLTECAKDGAKVFNEGKFKTADQVQDAARLLGGGRRVLSGLMKYGIIPELAFVGLEATGRSILGEKPLNAIKKSIDTFTFGLTDFTSGIEAEKFGKFGNLKLDVDKYRNSLAKVNSIQQDIANLEALNTGSDFGYEGDQTEAIQIKKAQLEAAKKELQQNMISPDKVSFIDRMSDNIADAQRAKSAEAKASAKDQMEGIPGVADYMDTETARVFPRQPSQTELNLKLFPNFREALKTKQAKIDRTILNAPDDVLQEIAPEALELKKGLQEAYKMENLKDTFGAEQIYGTQGVFSQPLAGGGIAKLAGIDEGPQRTSMNPDSQGLSGLLKNGMKI